MLNYRRIVTGEFDTNTYLLWSKGELCVIDPGDDILNQLNSIEKQPTRILLTHEHYDHIKGVPDIKEEYNISLCAHDKARELLKSPTNNLSAKMGASVSLNADVSVDEGDVLKLGDEKIEVLYTPGHSEGSISLVTEDFIICGDLIFSNGLGRVDLPGGSLAKLKASLLQIFQNHKDKKALPGHGPEFSLSKKNRENYL